MGFTTGFLGGVTLTYSLLYLSLHIHRANRSVQRTLLSQQAALLNSALEPLPAQRDPPAYELRKAGLTEELKDRWNREVERSVRKIQQTDWAQKRDEFEHRILSLWSSMKSSESAKEIEAKAKELERSIQTTVDAKLDATAQKGDQFTGREPRLLELK